MSQHHEPRLPHPVPPASDPDLDDAHRRVTAIAALVCLFRQWRALGRELERLARDLTCHDTDDGMEALDRACVALLVTDELMDLVSHELAGDLALGAEFRRELFAELLPWLEEVRHELPSAATILFTYTSAAATWREAAIAS